MTKGRDVDVIKKHSAAIQISNTINLTQRKMWNILTAYAYQEFPTEKKKFTISLKKLCSYLDYESRSDKRIKEYLKGLVKTSITWNVLGKDGKTTWGAAALLAACEIKDGICTYEYSSFLREVLYNPRMYAKIKLLIQNKFQSKHALALYELCLDYIGVGETPYIEIKKFRELMGIQETEYPDFKRLSTRVIKEPIEEINEVSDIFVKVVYKKDGRTVLYIKFLIQKMDEKGDIDEEIDLLKPPNILPEEEQIIDIPSSNIENIKQKELYKKLVAVGIAPRTANKFLTMYPQERIERQLIGIESRNPKDKAAMLVRAIEEDWGLPTEVIKKQESITRQERIKNLVNNAKRAKYIVFPNGAQYKICNVNEDGFIEIIQNGKECIVNPEKALEYNFV